jgi:hypothetical protein
MKAESFNFLITSFNNGLVSSRDQAQHLNLDSIIHELIENGAFSQSKNQISVICPNCEDMHQVAISPSDFKGYCADTGIIEAKPEELIRYVASSKWMLNNIRKSIDAPVSHSAKELLNNQLWFVGYTRIAEKLVPVYLARNVDHQIEWLEDYFQKNPGTSAGIVLLTFPHIRQRDLPNGIRPLALADAVDNSGDLSIAVNVLKRIWESAAEVSQELSYTPDFQHVTHNGTQHVFSGEKQRKVVEYLIKAFEAGTPSVKTSEMMSKLGMDSTTQFSHLFSKHPTWKQLIQYGTPKGYSSIIPHS